MLPVNELCAELLHHVRGHDPAFASKPNLNRSYWAPKIQTNKLREQRNRRLLKRSG